jgi:hypothetical protein
MSEPGSTRGVPHEDVLAVFDDRDDASEPLTAPEIADTLNASRRTVFDRLETLRDRGDVASKKIGARARVWWVPTDVDADGSTWRDGFGAFGDSDSGFGEHALDEREALNADLEERQRDLL